MNKILIIIILIIIVLYFTYRYDKKNIERFCEANINNNNIFKILAEYPLTVTKDGVITIKSEDESRLPIKLEMDLLKLGENFSFNLYNNETRCGNFSVKKDGTFIGVKNNFKVDPSGNLDFDKFIYKQGNLEKKDGSIKVDSIGNIVVDNELFRIVDNIPYFKVSKIILQKYNSVETYIEGFLNLLKHPLHIAGIQFKDISGNDIKPYRTNDGWVTKIANYTLSIKNMEQGWGSDITTSSFEDVSKVIKFVGKGNNHMEQSYTFNFTTPQLIKNIIITNRKDTFYNTITQRVEGYYNSINYSTLLIYGKSNGKEILLKTISLNAFENNPHYTKGSFFNPIVDALPPIRILDVNLYP